MFRKRSTHRRRSNQAGTAARRSRPEVVVLEGRALLSTFTVTRFDVDDAAIEGTFRWAVERANATAGADRIDFDPAVFDAGPGRTTIRLTAGQLSLTDTATTTISGPAAYRLTISGSSTSRVFFIDGGASAAFSGLTIAEGRAPLGGGVYIGTGTVTMTQVAIDRNVAAGGDSSAFPFGIAGGGIANIAGTLTMDGCTISRNQCSLNNPTPSNGGGLANGGTATLTNCTFGYNYADISAALYTQGGLLTVNQCSFGSNVVTDPLGGSFGVWGPVAGHNNIVVETINLSRLQQNLNDFDSFEVFNYPPASAFPHPGPFDYAGLAPLGYYGGPTETMPPTFDTRTVDVGDEYDGMPALDQRGFPRAGRIDVGAVEYRPLVINHVGHEAYTPTGVFRNDLGWDPLVPGPTPLGQLSLRQAVALSTSFAWRVQADGLPDSVSRNPSGRAARDARSEIRFDPVVFSTPRTISLSGPLQFDRLGDLLIFERVFNRGEVALIGPGADLLTIETGGPYYDQFGPTSQFQPFVASLSGITVSGNVQVTMRGRLTLEDVVIRDSGGVGLFVASYAQATLIGCTITGHQDRGVATRGQLTMIDTTVTSNAGGGLRVFEFGDHTQFARATLVRCTIRGNSSPVRGAGIDVYIDREFPDSRSGLVVTDSTVADNATVGDGGGLFLGAGMAVVTGSIFSGNSAGRGGGVYVDDASYRGSTDQIYRTSVLTVDHCTIADNTAPIGGNLYSDPAPVSVTLSSTLVAGGDIIAFSPITGSGNFVQDGSDGLPDTRTGNPRLAPLGDYGAPTWTRALLPGSPALDAGPAVAPAPLAAPAGVAAAPANEAGGSLIPGATYSYRVTAYNHLGETLASQAVAVTLPLNGTPDTGFRLYSVARVSWAAVPGALGYKIYGRTAGSEELLATVPFGLAGDWLNEFTQTFLDYGMAGPGGAPPSANTTGGPVDQRGLPRNVGTSSDIGAFESQGFTLAPVAGSTPQSTLVGTAFANPLAVSVTANNPIEPVDGGVVHFTAPESGASAALSAGTATIANGQAAVTATANLVDGEYVVAASVGGYGSHDFVLANVVAHVAVGPATLPGATAGVDYVQCLTASGGAGGPFTFAVTAGALPPGMTLSADGDLSGTSTVASNYTFTVTAAGPGGHSGTRMYNLTVNPAATSQFFVTGFPSPVTAGTPGTFTVTARDAYGNLTPDFVGSITFTSDDPQAALPAAVTLADGTGAFSATLKTSGSARSITATSGTIAGSLTKISVTPAAAVGFRIDAPTRVAKDAPFTIRVTALDAYGNVATGYRGTVGFRVSAPHPHDALPAGYTFTAADNGVRRFTVTLKRKGARTLTVRDRAIESIAGSTRITVV